jgi:hypothetical protein
MTMAARQRKPHEPNNMATVHWGSDVGVSDSVKPEVWMSKGVNLVCHTTLLDGRVAASLRHHGVGSDSGLSVCLGDRVIGVIGGQDLLNLLTKSLARFAFYRADTVDICPGLQEMEEPTRLHLGAGDDDELAAYLARESAKTARKEGLKVIRGGARKE